MGETSRKFQAPKGTRDFYPQDMAVRRYIERIWREVSINHGFEEVDGPMFEDIDLYTHKSGPGIVSEIFQVLSGKDEEQVEAMKAGKAAPYALRPEFTPTLARMVAAKASSLPMPIKWFAIPNHFRAERPQRGRLREFIQWNVDFIGEDSPRADAEVISTAISALEAFGLTSRDVRVAINDRVAVENTLLASGIKKEQLTLAFDLIDKSGKMPEADLNIACAKAGIDAGNLTLFTNPNAARALKDLTNDLVADLGGVDKNNAQLGHLTELQRELNARDLIDWCDYAPSIVRGLAYYTGTVFEIHEATGAERAIAGGGRYDNLIESFGGPKLSACGFGMGDVVLSLVLKDKGLLGEDRFMQDLRPDAFVIAADDEAAARLPAIVADLRRAGLHARHSYKATRNVGKLLGDAGKARARFAIILGKELAEQKVVVKNLEGGTQEEVAIGDLVVYLRNHHVG
ncbi:MAG TPA: histidine--tRNA ligase [Phycisphaerales bacterium]|nr:histidine--tRNA ligase [Phycisphaerales bacterium]